MPTEQQGHGPTRTPGPCPAQVRLRPTLSQKVKVTRVVDGRGEAGAREQRQVGGRMKRDLVETGYQLLSALCHVFKSKAHEMQIVRRMGYIERLRLRGQACDVPMKDGL